MAFVRMVSRLNPEQLQQGDLAYSQNGRMDNDRTWVPRKGVDVFAEAIPLEDILTLPFTLDDAGTPPELNDTAVNAVYGACQFVDPTTGIRHILVLTNSKAIAIEIDFGVGPFYYYAPDGVTRYLEPSGGFYIVANTFDVSYPGGTTLGGDVNAIQALDKVLVFRDGQTAWEWDGIVAGANAFAEVSTTPTAVTVDSDTDNAVVVDGVVTVTNGAGHGRSTGDVITVYYADDSGLVEGDKYEITLDGATPTTVYSFNAEIADGTYSLTLGGKQPLGGGYIAMPDPAWGVYHENRLIVPYARSLDTGGTTDDELIFSDIFDIETFDPIRHQFRMGAGSADSLVGVSPLLNDRLLVLNRNSVHVISGVSGSLNDATRTEVTREVGCVARKTIVEVGGTTMWLSDQGVYSATYGEELALVANAIPVSEPIEDQIRQINWAYADNAVAAYADNRYYLAVPYGTSTVNDTIFVYNFLNQGWESVDTFPAGFNIKDMLVVPYEGKNRLFVLNKDGALHLADEQVGQDRFQNDASATDTQAIDGQGVARLITFGTHDTKRFNRASFITTGNGSTGNLKVSAVSTDPDATRVIEDRDIADGEDYTLKGRIGKRGYGNQMKWETSSAKVRGYTVEAIVSNRSNADRF
jgi:hypothetical protein